jgi:hypothetical protein
MTQPIDRWGTAASARRIRELGREADNLAADARLLPGHDAADHSRIVQRVFTDLLQILPLLESPAGNRVLAQRLTIIQTSRAKLTSGSTELAMAPTIDTALQAADAALADISHGDSFAEADFRTELDTLSAKIDHLDFEKEPSLHRVDVAEVVDLMSQVVSKMAATLSARLTVESPGTQPAAPTTAPTTQPAAAPTTKP